MNEKGNHVAIGKERLLVLLALFLMKARSNGITVLHRGG